MLGPFHVKIMHLALDDRFSARALRTIIKANLRQDHLFGQIGHDEYHFDNNAFDKSYAYIEQQRALTISSLAAKEVSAAWKAFGRLTHTTQDFYAHSNYVDLWLSRQPVGAASDPSEISPLDIDLINSSHLRSGKVYALELLTLIPGLRPLFMPLLPRDSHGWMNLDAPARSPNFRYAFQAAAKRTRVEFERTTKDLPKESLQMFLDQ